VTSEKKEVNSFWGETGGGKIKGEGGAQPKGGVGDKLKWNSAILFIKKKGKKRRGVVFRTRRKKMIEGKRQGAKVFKGGNRGTLTPHFLTLRGVGGGGIIQRKSEKGGVWK